MGSQLQNAVAKRWDWDSLAAYDMRFDTALRQTLLNKHYVRNDEINKTIRFGCAPRTQQPAICSVKNQGLAGARSLLANILH